MEFHHRIMLNRIQRMAHIFRSYLFCSSLLLSLLAVTASGPALSGSVTYVYDTLGRLSTATYSSGVVITYVYDAAGNRTSYVTTGSP